MSEIKVILRGGKMPKRGSKHAAGMDIHTVKTIVLEPKTRKLVRTGVFLAEIPHSTYLRVAPRSKLANHHGIDVFGGVIDEDYREEICVILYNSDETSFITLEKGEAVAQLILEKHLPAQLTQVNEAGVTERGKRGVKNKSYVSSYDMGA